MNKTDLREVLNLVKAKLKSDAATACALFWPDVAPTTLYSVGEEDCNTDYAIGECDCNTLYAIGECDAPEYAIGE